MMDPGDMEPDGFIDAEEYHDAPPPRRERELSVFDASVPTIDGEDAWAMLQTADKGKEAIAIRHALLCYARSQPELTFSELEGALRSNQMHTFLIAKEQEVSDTMTVVDLQGIKDRQFVVNVQFSTNPPRKRFASGWPSSPAENIERLADAGFVVDRGMPKCRNCDELGHIARECPNERVEREKQVITCGNCQEVGHYYRDCPQPRGRRDVELDENGEPMPAREPMKCRNCLEEGHKASDCTNERVMICRNCDEPGHSSRECPKPRDYSRIECRQCGEKGHTQVRCKNPPKAEDEAPFDGNESVAGGAGYESVEENFANMAVVEGEVDVGAQDSGDVVAQDASGFAW